MMMMDVYIWLVSLYFWQHAAEAGHMRPVFLAQTVITLLHCGFSANHLN